HLPVEFAVVPARFSHSIRPPRKKHKRRHGLGANPRRGKIAVVPPCPIPYIPPFSIAAHDSPPQPLPSSPRGHSAAAVTDRRGANPPLPTGRAALIANALRYLLVPLAAIALPAPPLALPPPWHPPARAARA